MDPSRLENVDSTRQACALLRTFGVVSVVFGVISLLSGVSAISCILQLASGSVWLSITSSPPAYATALQRGRFEACCGGGLAAVRGLNIAGIVFAVLDGIWGVVLFSISTSSYLRYYSSSSYSSYSYCCEPNTYGGSCTAYSRGRCIYGGGDSSSLFSWFGYLTGHAAITMIANLCLNSASLTFLSIVAAADPLQVSVGERSPLIGDGGVYARQQPYGSTFPPQHQQEGYQQQQQYVPTASGYGTGAAAGLGGYGAGAGGAKQQPVDYQAPTAEVSEYKVVEQVRGVPVFSKSFEGSKD